MLFYIVFFSRPGEISPFPLQEPGLLPDNSELDPAAWTGAGPELRGHAQEPGGELSCHLCICAQRIQQSVSHRASDLHS